MQKGQRAHGGEQHLERRAAEDVEEARQDEREDVAGLVDDEVDAVQEAQRAAPGVEVELALKDLPAEHGHHQQAQGPAGDGAPRYDGSC